MTRTSKTIVFFGNERLVSGLTHTDTPILNGLIERHYKIAAVVSHYSESRSRKQRKLEVAAVAEQHNIPLYLPKNPTDIIGTLQSLNPDAAVLVAYGRIIPKSIIDIFPYGIINIHPSLLPKHRGPTPIESTILDGDHETGVSIMQLSAGMDEGPVYAQQKIPLQGNEAKYDLYEKLAEISATSLFETLPRILDGSLTPTKQDTTQATYSRLLTKPDGVIDWNKPADLIAREIRAYLDWPGSHTRLGSIEVIIRGAHALPDNFAKTGDYRIDRSLTVQTGSGSLSVSTIQPIGKKEMPIQAFLAGYKDKLKLIDN